LLFAFLWDYPTGATEDKKPAIVEVLEKTKKKNCQNNRYSFINFFFKNHSINTQALQEANTKQQLKAHSIPLRRFLIPCFFFVMFLKLGKSAYTTGLVGLARTRMLARPGPLAAAATAARSVTTGARALDPETRKMLGEILATEDAATQKQANGGAINHYRLESGGLVNHDIFWGDMDTFGHVNNVMYLKWFETGK